MKQFVDQASQKKLNRQQKAWLIIELARLGKDTDAPLALISLGELIAILERHYQDIGIEYDGENWQVFLDEEPVKEAYHLIDVLWQAVVIICGKQS